jgi:hypothetical protein
MFDTYDFGQGSNVRAIEATGTAVLATGDNSGRRGLSIYNGASTQLYCKWGSGVSSSSFSFILQSGDYYEMPYRYTVEPLYVMWDGSPVGNAMLTETLSPKPLGF